MDDDETYKKAFIAAMKAIEDLGEDKKSHDSMQNDTENIICTA